MAKYARGKYSLSISDRSGQAFPYLEMVKEWTGALVHISEYEPKQPQLDPPYHRADAIALRNPRPQRFQQPKDRSGVFADSGGITVGVANLSLPGQFAFRVPTVNFTGNGITTPGNTMIPENGSLQNRRRNLIVSQGNVEVSIT
ncbi:MAG: hypothetical protein CBE47_02780 [Pelagibacteraceae bacterium TMED287]|jgi:hypothetical protein|nr:MAG: hypothetical protein CBE47_02780 [Pelagibacteraceae bacterium TMED287]|tara:strand:- start:11369 stop:11800 length:432 start_codon:yes stop_codon:yes gene_type:complete